MLRFLVFRILGAIPILILLSIVTFLIIQAPPGDYGDYIRTMAINRTGATAEQAQAMAEAYRQANGLNEINAAIVQLDRLTQENAGFVGQASEAGRDLALEVADLRERLNAFRTSA